MSGKSIWNLCNWINTFLWILFKWKWVAWVSLFYFVIFKFVFELNMNSWNWTEHEWLNWIFLNLFKSGVESRKFREIFLFLNEQIIGVLRTQSKIYDGAFLRKYYTYIILSLRIIKYMPKGRLITIVKGQSSFGT